MDNSESPVGVHTHTHTHTQGNLKEEKRVDNIYSKNVVNKILEIDLYKTQDKCFL